MRILQVVRSLDIGGLERVVLDLMVGLRDRGTVCCLASLCEPGTWGQDCAAEGRWVGHLGERSRRQTLMSLCRYVREQEIDVIHSHNPQPHLFAVGAGLLTGTPVVHTKHGRNAFARPKAVWLNRQLARCSAHVVAVSDDAADVALKIERAPEGRVTVIRNGIAPQLYACVGDQRDSLRREFGVPADAFVIGSVGRYSAEKCYSKMVEAFSLFRDASVKTGALSGESRGAGTPYLVLVGDGPDRPNIESAIEECGLQGQVRLTGMTDRVGSWLGAMDVFALSSRTEGTSITLLEAGASGLPLVVTDVGGNREVVNGGSAGLIVPPGDARAMAAAFRSLYDDRAMGYDLGLKAREHVEHEYGIDAMMERYVAIYEASAEAGPWSCLIRSLVGSGRVWETDQKRES